MIEVILSMAQEGAFTQGAAGMHIFDIFDNSDMRKKGENKKFLAQDDCNKTFSVELQGFDDAYGFNDDSGSGDDLVVIENMDGGSQLKITICDQFGTKEFDANLTEDNNSGDLSMDISSQISPHDTLRLARQVFRMNHQLQRQALQEKFHISAKKSPKHFQDLIKKSDHSDHDSSDHTDDHDDHSDHDDFDSGHYFQDLVSGGDHGGGDHSGSGFGR